MSANRVISSEGFAEDVSQKASLTQAEQDKLSSINKAIYGIREKSEIIPLIDNLVTIAAKHPEFKVINMYAEIVKPLRSLEGIVWKLRPLVKDCGSCHLTVLNSIKKLYYKTYLTGPHVKAFYDFLIEPNIKEKQFDSISELQDFAAKNGGFIENFESSISKLDKLIASLPSDFEFNFDNYLLSGFFEDAKNPSNNIQFMSDKAERRYKRVVKGNLQLLLAQKYKALGVLKLSINYNFNAVPELMGYIVKKTALNSLSIPFFNNLPRNATPIQFLKYLQKSSFKSIATVRKTHEILIDGKLKKVAFTKEDIQQNLDFSFDSIIKSIELRRDGIKGSIAQSTNYSDASYIIKPSSLLINDEKIIKNLTTRLEMYESARTGSVAPITSEATGLTFIVNPKIFFTYHEDLKSVFLPKFGGRDSGRSFASNVRGGCIPKNAKTKSLADSIARLTVTAVEQMSRNRNCVRNEETGDKIHKWDFYYGMPIAWNDPTMGGLLPGTTNENFYEKLRALKLTPATRRIGLILPFL